MWFSAVVSLVFIIFGGFFAEGLIGGNFDLVILTMGQCRHNAKTPLMFENVMLEKEKSKKGDIYHITGNINILKKIVGPLKLSLALRKCEDDAFLICSDFFNYVHDDFCEASDDSFPSLYAKVLGIKQDCPMERERYAMKNSSITMGPVVKNIFASSKFWVITLEGHNNKGAVLCQWAELRREDQAKSRYG